MASIFLPTGEDVEDICGKEELVTFSDVSQAYAPDHHVNVKYQLGSRVETSPRDWIGIFPHRWESVSQPLASISLAYTERNQTKFRQKSVTFSVATIQNLESREAFYQFVYVDSNHHVLGVSIPFQVTSSSREMSLKEKKASDSGAESESESPVVISSTSDDEEDWDLGNQSLTLRQPDPLVLTPQPEGGSSTSDLSDIVVLSTSPSQEAARLQEEHVDTTGQSRMVDVFNAIGWSAVTNDRAGASSVQSTDRDCNQDRSNTKHQEVENARSPTKDAVGTLGKAPKEKNKIHVHVSPLSRCNKPFLFSQLKFVKSPVTSDDENGKLEDERADKNRSKRKDCPKLITVMQENVTCPKSSLKIKRETVKAQEHTEKSDTVVTPCAVTELLEDDLASCQSTRAHTKKSKKAKKKIRRDKKQTVDLSDDEQMKQPSKSDTMNRETPKPTPGGAENICYEDEILTGWSVGKPGNPMVLSKSVVFDELPNHDTKVKTELAKSTLYHNRWMDTTETCWDATFLAMSGEGEVYACDSPVKPAVHVYNQSLKMRQPDLLALSNGVHSSHALQESSKLRSKKNSKSCPKDTAGKRRKQKARRGGENQMAEWSTNNDEPEFRTRTEIPRDKLSLEHQNDVEFKKWTHEQMSTHQEFNELKKPTQRTKAGDPKKEKRPGSRTRKLQLSRQFQYLFSLDTQTSTTTSEMPEIKSDSNASPSETCQGVAHSVLALQDTSEDGFPALPSQKNTTDAGIGARDNEMNLRVQNSQRQCKEESHREDDEEEEDVSCTEERSLSCGADAKDQLLPYVPPYVLDVMDALPPASVSPDGRAMEEWRRALLPFIPKHSLPMFHTKYRAKFARKHELRRLRLRRVALGRNSGIIDRIRHQLALPDLPDARTKRWQKLSRSTGAVPQSPGTVFENLKPAGEEKSQPLDSLQEHLLSYASVVKKNKDAKGEIGQDDTSKTCKDQCATELSDATTKEVSITSRRDPDEETCLALVSTDTGPSQSFLKIEPKSVESAFKYRISDGDAGLTNRENKTVAKVARNFPTEFTNYTSLSGSGAAPSSPSQLQLVPFCSSQAPCAASAASMDRETSSISLSWPSPRFITSTHPVTGRVGCPESHEAALPSRGHDTPGVHIRPAAKTQSKVEHLSSSPPRKPRLFERGSDKEKASVPQGTVDQGEVEERKALLDLALCSCLEDNAQLRTTVASLERQLENLRMEQQDLKEQAHSTPEQKCGIQGEAEGQRTHSHSPQTSSETVKPKAEQRRVPVCKWAGKLSKLVRTNVKIVSLVAKVKDYEREIASLHNQVNSLKEALQEESQRSSRALTKWFKLKLKVRALKSTVREMKREGEYSPREPVDSQQADIRRPPDNLCPTGTDARPKSAQEQTAEDGEPPCKRAKLESDVESQTKIQCEGFDKDHAPPPESPSLKSSTLIPAPVHRPQRLHCPVVAPVLNSCSPPEGTVFRLFPGQDGECKRKVSEPSAGQQRYQEQAVVSPMCHNAFETGSQHSTQPAAHSHTKLVHTKPLHRQTQQVSPHMYTAQGHFPPEQPSRSNGTLHRKRSPPHLPLPTPFQPPISPPRGNPFCFVPPQPTAPSVQSNTFQHLIFRPSPPPVPVAPYPQTCNPSFFSPDPYQVQAWPLSPPVAMVDPSVARQRQGPYVSSPWNQLPNHPLAWTVSGGDKEATRAPYHPNHEVLLSHLTQAPNRLELNCYQQPQLGPSNGVFQVIENEHNASNAYGRLHNNVRKDNFVKETHKSVGPCQNFSGKTHVLPAVTISGKKDPSPPGRYRSDFMRQMMRGEAAPTRRQPNPYRLFHRDEANSFYNNNHRNDKDPHPSFLPFSAEAEPGVAHAPASVAAETLISPPSLELLPVTDSEVCYRNTAAFVELNADGLVEATRQRLATAACGLDGMQNNNGASFINNNHCDTSDFFLTSRLIESQKACFSDSS